MRNDDWFDRESKSMIRGMAGWGLLAFIAYLAFWLALTAGAALIVKAVFL